MDAPDADETGTILDILSALAIVMALGVLWAAQAFQEMYAEFGVVLPASTQLVLDLWMVPFGLLLLGTLGGVGLYLKDPPHGRKVIRWTAMLALPVLGVTVIALYMPTFTMASGI